MKRISVTSLEKFRRFMTGASSYDTEEALIETLKDTFTGNDKTRFGEAYHKIIEGEYQVSGDMVYTDRFIFEKKQAKPALKYRLQHAHAVYETEGNKIFETKYGLIQVTYRLDVMEGLRLRDIKTKFRSVDFREYLASSQWKFYLSMLEADEFFYDVFEVKHFPPALRGNGPWAMPKDLEVIPHEPLQLLRYDGMEQDITGLLNSFLDYIELRNFYYLLKPAKDEVFDF